MRARLSLAIGVGRLARSLSRLTGRGGGNVVGGYIASWIEPQALRQLATHHRTIIVSGTNGKTTTTRFLAAAAGSAGPVVTNSDGANLPRALVSVLLDRRIARDACLVAEVDERWVPIVIDATSPVAVVLLNLSRDQLDRMEEVRTTGGRWREGLRQATAASTTVVANADDPIVVASVPDDRAVVWVGAGLRWREDATACPFCGARLAWEPVWHCGVCGRGRPDPQWWLDGEDLVARDGRRIHLALSVPGRHNLANAAMAIAAAALIGVEASTAARACASIDAVAGRYQSAWGVTTHGRVYLAKNPAGWVETLDVLDRERRPVVLAFNANGPDGRDPSWLYDVAFERLAGRPVVVTGERASDLSVRLRYADVDHTIITPLAAALEKGRALEADIVASYTAFGQVRAALDRG